MFLITALFIFLFLRRNRQRKRSPSQQYLQSVRSVSRTAGAVSPDRDIKDFSSSRATSPTKDKQTASYSKGFTRHLLITDSESGSTFKDSSVTIQSISAPFVPPPPRTNVPEAQPPQERLPTDLRNRPSRFVEQLMVNSTNLGVLLAIAKAEAEQRKRQKEITLSSSMTPLNPNTIMNDIFTNDHMLARSQVPCLLPPSHSSESQKNRRTTVHSTANRHRMCCSMTVFE
ncbi:hypothetical protein DFJ43DRAFT_323426 [Lentinula guzmanii]|uniref:Uncharacterized protein n=1 Tax=Lentinula guzmanii TaxID=2804957 RepID=A0AA38JM84_9AGAR|nr:hypothetical protein DFJ43DRAFT_323426 [Lentinula guzmanii]